MKELNENTYIKREEQQEFNENKNKYRVEE